MPLTIPLPRGARLGLPRLGPPEAPRIGRRSRGRAVLPRSVNGAGAGAGPHYRGLSGPRRVTYWKRPVPRHHMGASANDVTFHRVPPARKRHSARTVWCRYAIAPSPRKRGHSCGNGSWCAAGVHSRLRRPTGRRSRPGRCIGVGNHLLGQVSPHWGRLSTCPNDPFPAPMRSNPPRRARGEPPQERHSAHTDARTPGSAIPAVRADRQWNHNRTSPPTPPPPPWISRTH